MGNGTPEIARDLANQARQGSLAAGKKLIKMCREGMCVPYWEKEPEITMKDVELHLKRRGSLPTM